MIDQKLLEILACPLCKAEVRHETGPEGETPSSQPKSSPAEWLVCTQCHRRYPIRDGIPVMLVEEAELPR